MSVLGWVGGKCRNQGQILAFHLSGTAGSTARHCWAEQMRIELGLSLSPLRQDSHPRHRKARGRLWGSTSATVGLVSSAASITREFWQEALNISPSSELKYFLWIWRLSVWPACASSFFPWVIASEVFWMRNSLELTA